MVLLEEYLKEKDLSKFPRRFTATLDPFNPLSFLQSAFNYVDNQVQFFANESSESDVRTLVQKMREKYNKKQYEEAAFWKKDMEEAMMIETMNNIPHMYREIKTEYMRPNKCNGLYFDKYSWGQSLLEVSVDIPVPPGTMARSIVCDLKTNHLEVGIRGQPPIIDGELYSDVKIDYCFWTSEDMNTICIQLTKQDSKQYWWTCLIKGEPEIDTQMISPDLSRLSEMDVDSGTSVEKMRFDQMQKQIGLPTSAEIEKQEMLKNMMALNLGKQS